MGDVHTKRIRSFNMSQIKGKNTKPELIVRKFLHANGYRYGLHSKSLPGKPDIVLRKYKTVILINGCFWHGHNRCKYFVIPKSRREWWQGKIQRNQHNDKISMRELVSRGWKVIVIWECQLKQESNRTRVLSNLILNINESATKN